MNRLAIGLVAMIAVLAAAGALYTLKRKVEARRDHVAALAAQIAADKEAIRVLTAERAYLSSPARVETAVKALADHGRMTPDQVLPDFDAIAFRLDPDAPVDEADDLLPGRRSRPSAPMIAAVSQAQADHLFLIRQREERR